MTKHNLSGSAIEKKPLLCCKGDISRAANVGVRLERASMICFHLMEQLFEDAVCDTPGIHTLKRLAADNASAIVKLLRGR